MAEELRTSPQHRMLDGERAYAAGIDEVIDHAQKTLHIFDPDFTTGGYDTLRRADALRVFLARNRANRVVIVLHETEYLVRHCPRLMNLLRLYSHAISIFKTHEHGRVASDPMVIADEAHYVHRFHVDGTRALYALHDHVGARQLDERFGQLVESSSPAVFATTLGL
ncbi:MAG: hypothetical protein N2Z69_01590 [Methylophilaceae bacterium]|nr:hypothetical protein [Methylophilaceae bacterium]